MQDAAFAEAARDVRLADGTRVVIRPAHSDDARHADRFFSWLSQESKYLRFQYPVKELTPTMVAAALAQDGLRRVALIAELTHGQTDATASVIAIGRYAPTPKPDECEVAITVADPWQGNGIGRALLGWLIDAAKRGGYRSMGAIALTTNDRMIALARSFGFDVHVESEGVTTMRKALAV